MAVLLDTNILVRLANATDLQHAIAVSAVLELHRRGEVLNITPQVLIEFRNVATRPKALNGAGLTIGEAESHAAIFEAKFPLLEDSPEIFTTWKAIVSALGVIGKQVHDARLVAVCHSHQVDQLLTFNFSHFSRLATFGSELLVLDPDKV